MVNLYQLLGVSVDADAATIAFAISQCRLQGDINPQILDKAEEWWLKPEVRAQYDAQLRQHDATLFAPAASAPIPDTLSATAAPAWQAHDANAHQSEPQAIPVSTTSATGKKTFKTKAEPKHRIKLKHDGKKSGGRGCLIAFLIFVGVGLDCVWADFVVGLFHVSRREKNLERI